jgi:hypothetical protein
VSEYEPVWHGRQLDIPAVPAYFPMGQNMHDVDDVVSEYEPEGHN